jgi:3-methylcrotonyl-CoA carboxylase alpha subunit
VDGGAATPLHEVSRSGTQIAARLGAQRLQARVFNGAARVHLWTPTEHLELALDDPRTQQFESSAASGGLTTPLPGVVVSVPVKVGDEVQAGAVVMLIEAMKMEHAITAPHAGAVTAIHFAPGERVSEGSQLLEIAPRA